MIYSINFLEMTNKINPLAFSKYLRDTGWNVFPRKRTDIKIFQLQTDFDFFQVTIPMDKGLSDYKDAMYKAVETVALAEHKSVEQVMLYLLNPSADILKIRLEKREVEPGNILFDDAIRLYENAKKLLAATALDILHPKKYHQGRIDDSVLKFLSNCRFGQTEIGSYIVSVVCPFAELDENSKYKQLSIFSDEEQCADSLTRKVTTRIINNIVEIKNQIDNGDIDKLTSNKQEETIISANFYEALNGLNLDSEGTDIEFIAEWSSIVKNVSCSQNKIELSHDYYQPIESVITRLKEKRNKSSRIVGRVKKLESSPDLEKREMGKITLVYLGEDDRKRTVTAKLEKDDYGRAIEAHALGSYVEIEGELTSGRNATITCDSFTIIT